MWKKIDGFSIYSISENGEIRNDKTGKLMTIIPRKDGYWHISIYSDSGIRKTVLIHRLVAIAYIPNPENKPFINHKDGNRGSLDINNMEWCTNAENVYHAYHSLGAKGAMFGRSGVLHNKSKEVLMIECDTKQKIKSFGSAAEAARSIGSHSGSICRAIKNKKLYRSFFWAYAK